MKKYLTLAAILLFSVLLYSCDNTDIPVESGFTEPFDSATGDKPEVLWQKAFGGESTVDYATTVSIFPNEDMVVAGTTHSRATQGRDIRRRSMVLRLNGDGNLLWKRSLGNNADDSIYASAPLADGSVIIGGRTTSTTDKLSAGIWLVKLDKDGNTVWDKTFDSQGYYEVALCLLPMPDGNIFVMGNHTDKQNNITPYAAIIGQDGGIARQIDLSQLTNHATVSAIMDENRIIATVVAVSGTGQLTYRTKMIEFDADMAISTLDDSNGILHLAHIDGRLHVLGTEQNAGSLSQTVYNANYTDGLQNKNVFVEILSENSLTFAVMNKSAEWLCAAIIENAMPRSHLFAVDNSGKTIWSVETLTFTPIALNKLGNDFVVAGSRDTGNGNNQAMWVARLKDK